MFLNCGPAFSGKLDMGKSQFKFEREQTCLKINFNINISFQYTSAIKFCLHSR